MPALGIGLHCVDSTWIPMREAHDASEDCIATFRCPDDVAPAAPAGTGAAWGRLAGVEPVRKVLVVTRFIGSFRKKQACECQGDRMNAVTTNFSDSLLDVEVRPF